MTLAVLPASYKHLSDYTGPPDTPGYIVVNKLIAAAAAKSLQSCLTLCNPIDSSPTGSAIPRNLQARTLKWVTISFSNA